ncbi:MAG: hypothetical protein ACREOQ_21275 [Gemmatimonadales bacterium]
MSKPRRPNPPGPGERRSPQPVPLPAERPLRVPPPRVVPKHPVRTPTPNRRGR